MCYEKRWEMADSVKCRRRTKSLERIAEGPNFLASAVDSRATSTSESCIFEGRRCQSERIEMLETMSERLKL